MPKLSATEAEITHRLQDRVKTMPPQQSWVIFCSLLRSTMMDMNQLRIKLGIRQYAAYLIAVFVAMMIFAVLLCIVEQCVDHSASAYRMAGMEELRWVPDPGMCAVVIVAVVFSAGPKTAVMSFIPWLISLIFIKRYELKGLLVFVLIGAVIAVLIGCFALPLLNYILHPSNAMRVFPWNKWHNFWGDFSFNFAMCILSGMIGGLTYWWLARQRRFARSENL